MTQISILGCGWLGWPLAERLIEKGYRIKGATTSEDKLPELQNSRIEPYLIALSSTGVVGDVSSFLENSTILIVNIPPRLRGSESDNFIGKITTLLPFIKTSSVTKILFVSSTSVYPDNNQIITEAEIPNPDSESGKQLIEVEKLLMGNNSFQTTVVRFGGLIGNGRHPIGLLSEKKNMAMILNIFRA